ncbi:hypothetical protein [Hymenobacter latericus]|uniref:hypothetical protein n=1 Tax=Hymenobacter sp. YIM 151858-1 TaxID=2987688 RepID=UPI0022278376|nr:hypothetical protein [Hymenobacter sp. YIM 151858-1]UYZ59500.1 hypothetical protein OIS50_01570 [Hymenobacter sp. YIM 151858-1]
MLPETSSARLNPSDVLERLTQRLPKVVSPQAHALFDLAAFPAMLGLAYWLWPRNRPAAKLLLANALLEGPNATVTNFPPAVVPLLSFRTHVSTGLVGLPIYTAVSLLTKNIPLKYRLLPLAFGVVPLIVNALSNTRAGGEGMVEHSVAEALSNADSARI